MFFRIAAGIVCSTEKSSVFDRFRVPVAESSEPLVQLRITQAEVGRAGLPLGMAGRLGTFSVDGDHLSCACDWNFDSIRLVLQLCCALGAWRTGGVLLHGAGLIASDDASVLALAPSGGGKSTLTDLVRLRSLSDECVIAHPGPPPTLAGTVIRSSARKTPSLETRPLRALLLLEKSVRPFYEKLHSADGLRALAHQAFRFPSELGMKGSVLSRLAPVANSVPTYRFAFPKSAQADDLLSSLLNDLAKTNP